MKHDRVYIPAFGWTCRVCTATGGYDSEPYWSADCRVSNKIRRARLARAHTNLNTAATEALWALSVGHWDDPSIIALDAARRAYRSAERHVRKQEPTIGPLPPELFTGTQQVKR